jgi:endonuclease-8
LGGRRKAGQDGGVPEGDTVWLAGRRLHDALAGRVLTRFDLRVPRHAVADLTGRSVVDVASRGKHLLTRIDDVTLHTHFRMDGSWQLVRPGGRWRGPAHEVRAVLANTDWEAVGHRLHDVLLLPTVAEHRVVGHLGPDLLGPDWVPDEAVRRLAGRPDREIGEAVPDQRSIAGAATSVATDLLAATAAGFWVEDEAVRRLLGQPELSIGEALLDQRNVAGIGTVYRAETLFLRGLHPWTPVHQVTDLHRLLQLTRRLMIANRENPGQVTTGDPRRGREHWVYGRAGEPCRRCGNPVRRASQGPTAEARVTYWCPTCQPDRRT